MSAENPKFLKKKFGLHNEPEVKAATARTKIRTDETIPNSGEAQIQNYLNRFTEILDREDLEKRERGIKALKQLLHEKFLIKLEEIPDAYFKLQQRIAREQGHGVIEITEGLRRQHAEIIAVDQRATLDAWVEYLASPDALYPDWLKYFALRSVLGMAEYDKEKKEFPKRSKGTTKPFPELREDALAYVLSEIEKKEDGMAPSYPERGNVEGAQIDDFLKFRKEENFSKMYAWAIEKINPISQELLKNTDGQWIKYDRGSDHMPLVESLQGYGTGWCTVGESTAKTQLGMGDFHVYYTHDENGKAVVPRVAIRMDGHRIAEVRGVAERQNLDPYVGDIVENKLKEFDDGDVYKKKAADMKALTALEKRMNDGAILSKDELVFLYEINEPIIGFGYSDDPRIKELRAMRDVTNDIPVVCACTPEEVAFTPDTVNEKTRIYVGPLFGGIFHMGLEQIFFSFPDQKIKEIKNVSVGGKTKNELAQMLHENNIGFGWVTGDQIFGSPEFTTTVTEEKVTFVEVSPKELGFTASREQMFPTTSQEKLFKKAMAVGLLPCTPEAVPAVRLAYIDQPSVDFSSIAMEPISVGSPGSPEGSVTLGLVRRGRELVIDTSPSGERFNLEARVIFMVLPLHET